MKRSSIVLSLLLSGATALGTAQMMPGPTGQTGGYPQTGGVPGQAGRAGTMPGEIPPMGDPNNPNNPNNPNAQQTGQQQPQAQPRVDDATLEHDVKQQLAADPAFTAVQVQVHNGKVDLTGSVPEKNDRKKAKDMAKNVPGVMGVKEHLTVGAGNGSMSSGTAGGTMNGSGQNTAGSISGNSNGSKPASGTTPAGTNNPSSTNPPDQTQPQSDQQPHAGLTTTPPSGGARLVEAAWQQPANNYPDASSKGSQQAPNGAPSPAAKTAPSTDSSNSAPLAPGSQNSSALQSQIENAIRNEPTLANSHVAVNVTDDAVNLTGTVPSSKEKDSAERLARSFGQNRKVKNDLVVTGHGTSDMSPDHPAMNNSGTGNSQPNPATTPHRQ